MGLQEKRHIKELQDNAVPGFISGLEEITGKKIKIQIDWDSLSDDLEALQNIEHQGLDRIHGAIKSICVDDLGKEGIGDKLNTIKVKNVDVPAKKKNTFEKGILSIHAAWGKSWEGYCEEVDIKKLLEDAL